MAPFSNGGQPVDEYEVLTHHHDVRLAINVFHSTKLNEQIVGLRNGSVYTFRVGAHNASRWSPISARSPG